MAKAPVAGAVKTRLIPALGAELAAAVQDELLRRTVEPLLAARLCPVWLCCAPTPHHPSFARLGRLGARLTAQGEGDLGERMARAARAILGQAERVVLIGTDIPELEVAHVAEALSALENGRDAVLGPSEDGGYYLLGLRRPADELFHAIPWSSAEVARVTRERMLRLGWQWLELPELWDLDRPADWERFRALAPDGFGTPG